MNNVSLSPVASEPATPPTLPTLPAEMIRAIVALLPGADNATLSRLARTCSDLWQAAGTDALLSFFYAARDAYETGNTHKKAAVFRVLADWIGKIAHQLPEGSRWQLIEHLSRMAETDQLAPHTTIEDYDDKVSRLVLPAVESVLGLARRELHGHIASIEAGTRAASAATLAAGFDLATSLDRLARLQCVHLALAIRKFNATLEPRD